MVCDVLRSFYKTKIRLRVGDEEVVATIRWYKAPEGAVPLSENSFNSNVWNTLDLTQYPTDTIGEIGLDRSWDNGIAPAGVSGTLTPTPIDWFVNGPPADAILNPPITDCPTLTAASVSRLGLGAQLTVKIRDESRKTGLGIGGIVDAIIPGHAYCIGSLGIGASIDARIGDKVYSFSSIGIGGIFNSSLSPSLAGGMGLAGSVSAYGEGQSYTGSLIGIGGSINYVIPDEPELAGGMGLAGTVEGSTVGPPSEGGGMGGTIDYYFT